MVRDTRINKSVFGGIVFWDKSRSVDDIRKIILDATKPLTGVLDIQRVGYRRYYAREGYDLSFMDRVYSGLKTKEIERDNDYIFRDRFNSKRDFRPKDTRGFKWKIYDKTDIALDIASNTSWGTFSMLKRDGKIVYYTSESHNYLIDRGYGTEKGSMIHIMRGEDAPENLVSIVFEDLRRKFYPEFYN